MDALPCPPRRRGPQRGELKDEEPGLLIPYLRLDCLRDANACPLSTASSPTHSEGRLCSESFGRNNVAAEEDLRPAA